MATSTAPAPPPVDLGTCPVCGAPLVSRLDGDVECRPRAGAIAAHRFGVNGPPERWSGPAPRKYAPPANPRHTPPAAPRHPA